MKHPSPYRRSPVADMKRGFDGPQRALMIMILVDIVVVFALAALFLVWMFQADDARSQLIFGVLFLAAFVAGALLKMGWVQRLDRLAILDAVQELRDRERG